MKKEQFRSIVKEIIKEVLDDFDAPPIGRAGLPPDDDNPDAPLDMTGIHPTREKDAEWRRIVRELEKIKNEPGFQQELKNLLARRGETPFEPDDESLAGRLKKFKSSKKYS